jgi:hypothetical protein
MVSIVDRGAVATQSYVSQGAWARLGEGVHYVVDLALVKYPLVTTISAIAVVALACLVVIMHYRTGAWFSWLSTKFWSTDGALACSLEREFSRLILEGKSNIEITQALALWVQKQPSLKGKISFTVYTYSFEDNSRGIRVRTTLSDNDCYYYVYNLLRKRYKVRSVRFVDCNNLNGTVCRAFTSIRSIGFERCAHFNDKGLKYISKWVEELVLRDVHIGHDAISNLGDLPHLKRLELKNCDAVTDESLELISHWASMKILTLICCAQISDRGIKYVIERLRSLRKFSVEGCKHVKGSAIGSIEACSYELLKMVGMSDFDRRQLSARLYDSLLRVDVSNNRWVDSDCVAALLAKPGLLELDVEGCISVKDESFIEGKALALEKVMLAGTPISDRGIAYLLSWAKNLKQLCLGNRMITGVSLEVLKKEAPELRFLDVRTCSKLTSSDIAGLHTLSSLYSLEVPPGAVDDDLLRVIGAAGNFRGLRRLSIGGGRITDEGIRGLLTDSCFDELVLSYCLDITDDALRALGRMPQKALDVLDLTDCPLITNSGVAQLCEHPVRRLVLYGTAVDNRLDLSAFGMLEYIDIRNTHITRDRVRQMKTENPLIKVIF